MAREGERGGEGRGGEGGREGEEEGEGGGEGDGWLDFGLVLVLEDIIYKGRDRHHDSACASLHPTLLPCIDPETMTSPSSCLAIARTHSLPLSQR